MNIGTKSDNILFKVHEILGTGSLMLDEQIRLCAKNDRRAQKFIYENFFGKMFAICTRYVNNHEDAMDILNRGFLKAYTNIEQFSFIGSFEGWLRKIMVNSALDYIKSQKEYKKQIFLEQGTHFADNIIIENDALSKINLEDVYSLIQQLPPISRTVFNLYIIDGFTHKNIGEMMGISEGTSKWHVSFARAKLKDSLKKKQVKLELAYG